MQYTARKQDVHMHKTVRFPRRLLDFELEFWTGRGVRSIGRRGCRGGGVEGWELGYREIEGGICPFLGSGAIGYWVRGDAI